MLLLHVLVALSSLALCTAQVFKPSPNGILFGKIGIIATLASGTILTILSQGSPTRLCISGLVFTAVCSAMTTYGEKQLAK
ncbi:MAG: hypothetical protein AAB459_03655 [Patescibacteria group bacterium]